MGEQGRHHLPCAAAGDLPISAYTRADHGWVIPGMDTALPSSLQPEESEGRFYFEPCGISSLSPGSCLVLRDKKTERGVSFQLRTHFHHRGPGAAAPAQCQWLCPRLSCGISLPAQLGCAGAWSDPAIPDSGDREVPALTSARHSSIGWRHHRDALSFPDCTLKSGGILLSFGPARTDFIYLFLR